MWKKECCRCYHQGPENNIFGYACDAAKLQGFRNISIMYWLENDPKHEPGPISVYSTLCETCHSITLKEYFDMLNGFVIRHDYRFHGGAGGCSNMCRRHEGDFDDYTICANCRREYHRGFGEHYSSELKAGYINVGIGENDPGSTGMSFCPECPRKLTINDVKRLYAKIKPIHDKEWRENWNKWEATMEAKWGKDWRTPKQMSSNPVLDDICFD